MNQQRQAGRRQEGKGPVQVKGPDVGKILDARMDQKGLQAQNPRRQQTRQVLGARGDQAAPKPHVDPQLALGGLKLGPEGLGRDGDGTGVQGHVDERGHAAGRGCPGGRGKTLPIRPSRLVDMHMHVGQAGHQDQIAQVDDRKPRFPDGVVGFEGRDLPVLDHDGTGGQVPLAQDAAAA